MLQRTYQHFTLNAVLTDMDLITAIISRLHSHALWAGHARDLAHVHQHAAPPGLSANLDGETWFSP